jgi:GAF domain-containing protein
MEPFAGGGRITPHMPTSTTSNTATTQRLSALAKYDILDTAAEADFDQLAELARTVCQVPIVTISFVDSRREWFKARIGLDVPELALKESFAPHVLAGPQVLVVPDASQHAKMAALPVVSGPEGIRFVAGIPLVTRAGIAIGALCVMDRTPRSHFSIEQRTALQTIARQVMAQMDLRRTVQDLAVTLCQKVAAEAAANELRLLLPMCSECKNVRSDEDYWIAVDEYLTSHSHRRLAYGVCEECRECREGSSSVPGVRPQPYPKLLGSRFRFRS